MCLAARLLFEPGVTGLRRLALGGSETLSAAVLSPAARRRQNCYGQVDATLRPTRERDFVDYIPSSATGV
jgi:hypothetical protein